MGLKAYSENVLMSYNFLNEFVLNCNPCFYHIKLFYYSPTIFVAHGHHL